MRRVLASVAFTDLDRLTPQVRAVQLQQVEGVEERPRLVPPVAEQLEGSHPLLVAAHHLAVDQAGPHLQVVHGLVLRGDNGVLPAPRALQ